jgi:hypothetical protein
LHPNYLLEALLDIYAICVKVQTVTFIWEIIKVPNVVFYIKNEELKYDEYLSTLILSFYKIVVDVFV